jgi:enamine deaminase RidA (YjgF/YER057c/UK114 family)
VAFGAEEKGAALAFQRLEKDLADAGARETDLAVVNVYPLSPAAEKMALRLYPGIPAVAGVVFEGLTSIDAGFAVDAVAGVSK